MSKEYGQKDMPDMRKLQASNTQTSDAACFFFVKNIVQNKDAKTIKASWTLESI